MDSKTLTLQAIDRLSPPRTPLYFCNREGEVFRLPQVMTGDFAAPERVR